MVSSMNKLFQNGNAHTHKKMMTKSICSQQLLHQPKWKMTLTDRFQSDDLIQDPKCIFYACFWHVTEIGCER